MSKPFYIDDHLPREAGGSTIAAFVRNSYPAEVLPNGNPFFVVISRGKNIRVIQSDGLSSEFANLDAVLEDAKGTKLVRVISFDPKAEARLRPILEKDAKWMTNSHYKGDEIYLTHWYKEE